MFLYFFFFLGFRAVLTQQSLPAAVRAGDVQPVHGVNCACVKLPLTDVTVTFSLFKINHCTNIILVVVLNILTVFFLPFFCLSHNIIHLSYSGH